MKKIYKSIVLLAVALVLLAPVTAFAAPKDTGKLQVGQLTLVESGQSTGNSSEFAAYESDSNTLTLTNYSGGAINITDMGDDFSVVIKSNTTVDGITASGTPVTVKTNGDLTVNGNVVSDSAVGFVGDCSVNISGYVQSGSADFVSGNGTVNVAGTITASGTVNVSAPIINMGQKVSSQGGVTLTASSLLTLNLGSNSLSLNPNSGIVSILFDSETPSDNSLTLPAAQKEGANFGDWDSTTGEHKYNTGDVATLSGNETLIADWNKKVISINQQPQSISVIEDSINQSIETEASVTDNSEISYAWYSCTDKDKNNANQLENQTDKKMNIDPSLKAGTYYYFCKLSAEGADDVFTNVAVVTVSTKIIPVPTDEPTTAPTDEPTTAPTEEPTTAPTDEPTTAPTDEPTTAPTDTPTPKPTATPTPKPTATPTPKPTATPTPKPTATPTPKPTATPTPKPTATATPRPTDPPPTAAPTAAPTSKPVVTPKPTATPRPRVTPTVKPTATPTPTPTPKPSSSAVPTVSPTPTPPPDSKGGINPLVIVLITGGVLAAAAAGILIVRYKMK